MKILFTIIIILLSTPAFATTYYVRPSAPGSDSNDGLSYANAFLTPSYGCSVMVAGDTLKIAGDGSPYTIDYNAPVRCEVADGTEGNITTIEAYDSADPPLISWKTAYTGGWTNTGTNLWTSTTQVESSLNDIQGFYKYDTTTGAVTILNKEFTTGAVDTEGDFYAYKGLSPQGKVLLYSATDPNTYTGEFRSITGAIGIDANGFYTPSYSITNNIKTIFNWIGFVLGSDQSNIIVNSGESNYGINRGFSGVPSSTTYLSYVTLNNCIVKNTLPSYTGYVIAPDQEGFKFGSGVNDGVVRVTNIVLNNPTMINMGYAGAQFSVGSSYVRVNGGLCHDSDLNVTVNIDGSCVRFGAAQNTPQTNYELTGFECYNSRNCVTLFGDVNNVKIHGNYFHDYTQGGVFLDVFSGFEACSEGTCNIYNNIFYNSSAPAFYLDESNGIYGYNNTVINSPLVTTLANSLYSTSGTFKNNIVINETGINLLTVDATGLIVSDNNYFYSPDASPFSYGGSSYSFANYKAASSQDAGSYFGDITSDFIDFAGGNYAIKSTATVKDLGATIPVFNYDYRLLTRPQGAGYSIGAYEEGEAASFKGITLQGVSVK